MAERDTKKVAEGLTEAQQAMVIGGMFSEDLAELGLCWFRAADIDFDNEFKVRPARWEWRKLGLAVRDHLRGEQ